MFDTYSILAAQWYPEEFAADLKEARALAKGRVLGQNSGFGAPTDDLTDEGMKVLLDVVAAARRRQEAEDRVHSRA